MRKNIALSAVSIGILVACGPVSVDLGGGSGGTDGTGVAGSYGVGGSAGEFVTGGTGGTGYAGAGGSLPLPCGDGVVQYPEICDDPADVECPIDCGVGSSVGGGPATGGTGAYGGTGGSATGGVGGSGIAGSAAYGVCGDGVLDYGEWCDDGNTVDGDGCTGDCRQEVGSTGGTGSGVGGGPATGGGAGEADTGGSGGSSGSSCVTESVESAGECADNDVLIGQAYERCSQLGRALTGVRFLAPCSDYGSYAIEIDCCDRPAGGAGAGGSG